MSESCWSVYIIRCGDGSLYTGTYEEFVSSLYARKEFPTPLNYWEQVAKTAAPAA